MKNYAEKLNTPEAKKLIRRLRQIYTQGRKWQEAGRDDKEDDWQNDRQNAALDLAEIIDITEDDVEATGESTTEIIERLLHLM